MVCTHPGTCAWLVPGDTGWLTAAVGECVPSCDSCSEVDPLAHSPNILVQKKRASLEE